MVSRGETSNFSDAGKVMQSTFTLTRVVSRTKRKRCSISTPNFSPLRQKDGTQRDILMSTFRVFRFHLFTNLSGIGGIALTRFVLSRICHRRHSLHSPTFVLRNRRLACRDLHRDISSLNKAGAISPVEHLHRQTVISM
jgi:hypothetical protein